MNCVMAKAKLSRSSQPLPAIFVVASLRFRGRRKEVVLVTRRLSCSRWIRASNLKLLEREVMFIIILHGDLGSVMTVYVFPLQ